MSVIRDGVRSLGWRFAPDVMADRGVIHQDRLLDKRGATQLGREFASRHGSRVIRGPLTGTHYHPDGHNAVAKLVGSYERELHKWISAALSAGPTRFVDIGSADGYYAVGLSRLGIPTVAFEMSPRQRRRLRDLADVNQCLVDARGVATAEAIGRVVVAQSLVLCDCEGAEVDLLDPGALREATVIVEIHDQLRAGGFDALRQRFAATHTIDVQPVDERRHDDYPELAAMRIDERDLALSEWRPDGNYWARFTPKS